MTGRNRFSLIVRIACHGLFVVAAPAAAQPAARSIDDTSPGAQQTERSNLHVDIEVDPIAYALSGFSLHAGIGLGHLRIDLGNFALAIPQFVHGDDGFDLSFTGYGVKVQLYPFAEQRGFFVGVDAGLARLLAERQRTQLAMRRDEVSLGVHAGYRIAIVANFYVTPWLGISYAFNAKDITLAGATTKATRITFFPTIHIGYQFR